MIDQSIFKAYDIRGIYPRQINKDTVYKIARAFVDFLDVKEVAVGYDMRVSTPELLPELYQGIADSGARVIELGQVGTELMYFAVGHYGYESGIMMTSSHNPAEYNGMKMVKKGSIALTGDTGIRQIGEMADTNDYQKINKEIVLIQQDPFTEYKNKILDLVDLSKLRNFKVVVDAGNGMGGFVMNKVFDEASIDIIPMYFELDGNFPNHEANPLKDENIAELKKKVVEENADLGIALDGDGDRVFFIDENGESSLGYYVVAILAEKLLKKYPGSKIVHENRNEWAIIDNVKKHGGIPIREKAGFSNLRGKMLETDAAFGGETSSHFFYKDTYTADSSMLTIALILEVLTEKDLSLSQLFKQYRDKYFVSGEINFRVQDADKTLSEVKRYLKDQRLEIIEIDGIAADKEREWHVSLRKSNTEPVVRLNVEGKSQEIVDQQVKEIEEIINSPRE